VTVFPPKFAQQSALTGNKVRDGMSVSINH